MSHNAPPIQSGYGSKTPVVRTNSNNPYAQQPTSVPSHLNPQPLSNSSAPIQGKTVIQTTGWGSDQEVTRIKNNVASQAYVPPMDPKRVQPQKSHQANIDQDSWNVVYPPVPSSSSNANKPPKSNQSGYGQSHLNANTPPSSNAYQPPRSNQSGYGQNHPTNTPPSSNAYAPPKSNQSGYGQPMK